MEPPFPAEAFFEFLSRYNAATWPAPIGAQTMGLVAITALATGSRNGDRLVLLILALFWGWDAVAYHWMYFAPLSPAAYAFGALFLLQAALFLVCALRPEPPRFAIAADARSLIAALLLIYAFSFNGGLARLLGHGGMDGPLFGVAPCPTTIFTLGLLCLMVGQDALRLAIVPGIWALIGLLAVPFFGAYEDLGLLIALAAFIALRYAATRGGLGEDPEAAGPHRP